MESIKDRMFTNTNNKDMSEDESHLPEVLQKLEIVPTECSQKAREKSKVKTNNPFCQLSTIDAESCDEIKLFGPKCECSRRSADSENSGDGTIVHNILNPTQFKHRHISNKFLLREPILKVLRRCMHHSHVKHKLTPYSRQQSHSTDCIDDRSVCPTLETLRIGKDVITARRNQSEDFAINKPNPLDFKALVQECDIISSTVSSSPSSSSTCVHTSIDKRKQGKQFTTIQSGDLRKGKESRKHKKLQSKVSSQSVCRQVAGSSSSSCSQQARMNANATACDVTIDELASYFETFVHIPKKMSSMAEMMYI